MNTPLWTPKPNAFRDSLIAQFIEKTNRRHSLSNHTFWQLHQWSITDPEKFWQAVSDFFSIKYFEPATAVVSKTKQITSTQWFVNSTLNYAENLLKRNDNKDALVFINEQGTRQSITFKKLHLEVAGLALALRKSGVKKGSRVAALMPNCIETIIAMLASTSIGAIWSSCSPDFGAQGILDRFSQIEPDVLFSVNGYFYNGKTHDVLDKLEVVEQNLQSLKKIVILAFASPNIDLGRLKKGCEYKNFIQYTDKIEFEPTSFDHPLFIVFSSGTTGRPKCIVHSVGGTLIQHLKEHGLHCNITENDNFFYFTTCGWMMWNWLVSGLALGATLILYDGSPSYPNLGRLINLIDEENISVFGTSAKYIAALEKERLKPINSHQLENLRLILSTGSPLSPHSFDYVYQSIKKDIQLCSISGGTDIISCFALGVSILPIYRGELQCPGLGMKVNVLDEAGLAMIGDKGELVCQNAFPSMPIYFLGDSNGQKYHSAYFTRFENTWAHGDFAKITSNKGFVIYGRSDAVLNPGGVRIGTAEIYRQVEKVEEVIDSVVIGQPWAGDVRVVLFVVLKRKQKLTPSIETKIKLTIRKNTTPRHVPAKIIQVGEVPRTISGKIVEIAVRKTVLGEDINNKEALANPDALEEFKDIAALDAD